MERPFKIENKVFVDERGTFAPLAIDYSQSEIKELNKQWIQSNISINPKKYTLRGLHFQLGDSSQSKLVKVINGSILDFVVDMRSNSEDYRKVYFFEMNPGDEVFVPKDFAHGFITKEDNTVVQYLVDNEYRPDKEGCVYWGHFESVVMKVLTICNNIDNITISEKDKVNKNYEGIN